MKRGVLFSPPLLPGQPPLLNTQRVQQYMAALTLKSRDVKLYICLLVVVDIWKVA